MFEDHDQRLTRWTEAVRASGVKLTHQRLEIFRELCSREDHPDAEAVFRAVRARVPTVSLDTVYRALWLLHDLGLIHTLGPRQDGIRFDVNTARHHHFTCLRCGLVRDFVSAELDALALPPELASLGLVQDARLEVRGLCAACQALSAVPLDDPPTPALRRQTP